MKTNEIRERFLRYFEQHDHTRVASGPLVPGDDQSLLFTNAGMVQFKDVFLGNEVRDYNRAVTSQRCVRAGGKHNDLENVGYTARHHTFFEMLGNFSFGDYFKSKAIGFAWDLLTNEYGLPADRLWVTVFEEDDEAAKIWTDEIGIAAERVIRIGAKDNFWAMGDTGPCGPCSEIFYDHGEGVEGGPPGSVDQDGDRYVEIWNLVFMQFNRVASGELIPLPRPSVDTGMGLERMAAVMQGVYSNYEIDLFENLIAATATVLGVSDLGDKSLYVIADHIRSITFLINDGVTPSNEGRGYVLRRIIRRAIRHGYQLGARTAFMHKLVDALVCEMGAAYPELTQSKRTVMTVLEQENTKFNETLEHGIRLLDQAIGKLSGDIIPGNTVFKLYDTFGFPVDLTADIAREKGLSIDMDGFDRAMGSQRERARAANQFVSANQVKVEGVEATGFSGYDRLEQATKVVAILLGNQPIDSLDAGIEAVVVLERSPFYAESGGQVGDKGCLIADDKVFEVSDTRYLANKVIGHYGVLRRGKLNKGQTLQAEVMVDTRLACAANHSATHLLHAALQEVLGEHVQQKGSLVEANRLRFDFSHFGPVTQTQMERIEHIVNGFIRTNSAVETRLMELEQARQAGAAALFGEKYADTVRVVSIGDFSLELCGGTHVKRSGDIGLIKIINESGVASGVRRLEAVSGHMAEQYIAEQQALLRQAAASIKTTPANLSAKIKSLVDANHGLEKQVQNLQSRLATAGSGESAHQQKEVNGVAVMVLRQDDADTRAMRATIDQCKQRLGSGIITIGGIRDGKVTLIAAVTPDLVRQYSAGKLIQAISPLIDGSGGGKPDLAQGGGSKISALAQVPAAVYDWVGEQQKSHAPL